VQLKARPHLFALLAKHTGSFGVQCLSAMGGDANPVDGRKTYTCITNNFEVVLATIPPRT
jgi:hypothetical protein